MRTCEHTRYRYECLSCRLEREQANREGLQTLVETVLVVGGGVLLTLAAIALS